MLGEARTGDSEAVTALAFNGIGSMLLAGHANGSVVLWEWHRGAWEAVKSVRGRGSDQNMCTGQHSMLMLHLPTMYFPTVCTSWADKQRTWCGADAHPAAVTACVFLDSSPQAALTADICGRLVFHNVSAYVSIMGAPCLDVAAWGASRLSSPNA